MTASEAYAGHLRDLLAQAIEQIKKHGHVEEGLWQRIDGVTDKMIEAMPR